MSVAFVYRMLAMWNIERKSYNQYLFRFLQSTYIHLLSFIIRKQVRGSAKDRFFFGALSPLLQSSLDSTLRSIFEIKYVPQGKTGICKKNSNIQTLSLLTVATSIRSFLRGKTKTRHEDYSVWRNVSFFDYLLSCWTAQPFLFFLFIIQNASCSPSTSASSFNQSLTCSILFSVVWYW